MRHPAPLGDPSPSLLGFLTGFLIGFLVAYTFVALRVVVTVAEQVAARGGIVMANEREDGPESLKSLMRLPGGAAPTPQRRSAPRRYWYAVGRDPEGNFCATERGNKRDAEWLAEEFRKDGYTDVEIRWSTQKR